MSALSAVHCKLGMSFLEGLLVGEFLVSDEHMCGPSTFIVDYTALA